jgi:2-dehydro-3-deoxyphosphogluconate aldolase/(4S)-4-hydroxy-2-oxoglutarate aldolase
VEPREALLALVDELVDAGVRAFEITFDAPSGADDLRAVRAHIGQRAHDVVIGAGTVTNDERLDAALACGADFGVAPHYDCALTDRALSSGLPFIPGAMTPTEIVIAWDAGATFVKLFPASAVGPAFVRELRGPLPDVQLIPTGGIDATNAAAFLQAGAAAVGIGGAITRATAEERAHLLRSLPRDAARP